MQKEHDEDHEGEGEDEGQDVQVPSKTQVEQPQT